MKKPPINAEPPSILSRSLMADALEKTQTPNNKIPQPQYDLSAKLDACVDLAARRTAFSVLAAAFTGLLIFRSPVSRWASVAFGAGVGIGSAYIESSYMFGGSPPKWSAPKVSATPTAPVPAPAPIPTPAPALEEQNLIAEDTT